MKGYEVRPGQYVIIEPEELDGLDPEPPTRIDILEFVELDQIDPVYFDKPYYLVPDRRAEKPYALLAQSLETIGKVGIAKFVMRTKEYLAAIRSTQGALVISTLLYGDEVVADRDARNARYRNRVQRTRAEDGRGADREPHREVRPRPSRGHLPRKGAGPHRPQGRRPGDRDAGRGRGAGARSRISWPRSKRACRPPGPSVPPKKTEVDVARSTAHAVEPRQGYVPDAALHQGGGHRLLRRASRR